VWRREASSRKLVVNVVAKAGGVNDFECDAHTILLNFYTTHQYFGSNGSIPCTHAHVHLPTWCSAIFTPCSTWA
jgi:hypothetical protein